jgi:sucrose-6-phosphate hydrolase SacC (GH32 family)
LQNLRNEKHHWQGAIIQPNTNLLSDIHGSSFEIIAEFKIINDIDCLGFRVHVGRDKQTTISYSVKDQKLHVDRTHSGVVDFKDGFAAVHSVGLSPINNMIRFHIFIDSLSVEVFANDGLVTFTESIFPSEDSQGLELFVEGGEVLVTLLDIYQLSPISYEVVEG